MNNKLPLNVGLRTKSVLMAMVLGVFFGLVLNALEAHGFTEVVFINTGLAFVGDVFIRLMKMLVVIVVFVSIVCGCSALVDKASLRQVGTGALCLYVTTTTLALVMAMVVASHVNFPSIDMVAQAGKTKYLLDQSQMVVTQWVDYLIPQNIFAALVNGSMLQVIFVAILLGACMTLAQQAGTRMARFFQDLNQVVTQMILLIMTLTPYGVFCLIAKLFSGLGLSMIVHLLGYFFLVLGLLLLHMVVVYGTLLRVLAKVSPWTFLKRLYPAMVVAFSVASSNVALPVTLQVAKKRLGIKPSMAEFVLPLGATINMDGTAIMQAVATVMLASWYHVDLTLGHYVIVVLTALLASIGTAGVPGIGMVTLAMVLDSVGIPLEGIGIIMGIDRLLDMARTAVNITGDSCIATVLASRHGALNHQLWSHKKELA